MLEHLPHGLFRLEFVSFNSKAERLARTLFLRFQHAHCDEAKSSTGFFLGSTQAQ